MISDLVVGIVLIVLFGLEVWAFFARFSKRR